MYKIDSPNSAAGEFVDLNPLTGTGGTIVAAAWMNEIEYELVNLIEAMGIVLAKGTRTQLRDAVKRSAGGFVTTVVFADSPKTLTLANAGLVLVDATNGNIVIGLPAANALGSASFEFIRTDGSVNTVTINRVGGDTFGHGPGAPAAIKLTDRYKPRLVISDGVSKWHVLSEPAPRALHGRQHLAIGRNTGAPNSKVDITADVLDVDTQRFNTVSLTVDIAAAGANGLDTGAEANDTHYFIWAIANVADPENPAIAGLLSTSRTAPAMPANYTLKELVGWVYNSGANFKQVVQYRADGGWHWVDAGSYSDGSGGAEADLAVLVLPPNELWRDGAQLEAFAKVSGDGVDNITFRRYFGATAISGPTASTISTTNGIACWMRLVRLSATTQFMVSPVMEGSTNALAALHASPGETLANAITLKCTGQRVSGSGSANVTQNLFIVEFKP